jgi:hypothetical protein
MTGAFGAPDVTAQLTVAGLKAGGGLVGRVTAEVEGKRGDIHLRGIVESLRVSGSRPDLFSASPVQFEAHADLAAEPHAFDIALSHRLLALVGHGDADDSGMRGAFTLDIPSLAPFAGALNVDMSGRGRVNATVTTKPLETLMALNGSLRVNSGSSVISRLLRWDTQFAALARLRQGNLNVDGLRLESGAVTASASGVISGNNSNFSWALALKDVSQLVSTLRGELALKGTLSGSSGARSVAATGSGWGKNSVK